jgi:hypothetical protein
MVIDKNATSQRNSASFVLEEAMMDLALYLSFMVSVYFWITNTDLNL